MELTDISNVRLMSQHIIKPKGETPKEVVSRMGAMQAQDFNMAKWGIGLRLPGSTEKTVEDALNNGEIIRTHLLRPTWHLVSAEDIYWMLELTAPRIKAAARSRDNDLGLNSEIFKKSNSIIEKALQKDKFLSRDDLVSKLEKAGIRTNENRASHLLMHSELDAVICSGETKGNKQTYTLLGSRVKKKKNFVREEALAQLALRYFTSRCPAMLEDFIWWSGLSAADGKHALELVKSNFISETIGKQVYWLTNSYSLPKQKGGSARLLPAFDEFLISYKDRNAALSAVHNRKAVSDNGIFRPIIVINGKAAGIWKRTIKKNKVVLETECFIMPENEIKNLIEKASAQYGKFLNKPVEVLHH